MPVENKVFYNPTQWVNRETRLNADNLNKLEQAMKTAYDNINVKADDKFSDSDLTIDVKD